MLNQIHYFSLTRLKPKVESWDLSQIFTRSGRMAEKLMVAYASRIPI
jgi:hypothetical protein